MATPLGSEAGTDGSDLLLPQSDSGIEELCRALGIRLVEWEFPVSVQALMTEHVIAVNPLVVVPERRLELVAHELGHWHLHRDGSVPLLDRDTDWIVRSKIERAAWEWARDHVLPQEMLFAEWDVDVDELAMQRGVTTAFVSKCLRSYLGQLAPNEWRG